jgi:GNAT superfamily N-acetyltransferase
MGQRPQVHSTCQRKHSGFPPSHAFDCFQSVIWEEKTVIDVVRSGITLTAMTDHAAVRISIETDTADELRHAVNSGLYAYNDRFAGPMGNSMLMIGARDGDRKIIGGLVANVQSGWKWIHIQRLWVDEAYRGAGIGRWLMEAAEKEAQKLGILYAAVDTMEFQARGFYEKQGYTVYGVMEDYPYGHRKFHLRKTLNVEVYTAKETTGRLP